MDNPHAPLAQALQQWVSETKAEYLHSNAQLDEPFDFAFYDRLRFDTFDGWLGNADAERRLNPDFAAFGRRGCGTKAALWLLPERDIHDAPVVVVSSEGELGVIAPNYPVFVQMVSLGYDLFQLLSGDTRETPWHSANASLQDWLRRVHPMEIPDDPGAWIAQARQANPDLEKTVFG